MKRCFASLSLAFIFLLGSPIDVISRPFNDVTVHHFAYEAINFASDPANGAFMVGDRGGNFNPRRTMTKFEASRIFALAAGFRHVLPSLDAGQQEVQNRATAMWRLFLVQMANQHARWSASHDGEIAFLLYKGILTLEDASGFVEMAGHNEAHALLSVADAALWAGRLSGSDGHELETPGAIDRAVTRAELAVMLHSALYRPDETDEDEESHTVPIAPIAATAVPGFAADAEPEPATIRGRIERVSAVTQSSITMRTANGGLFTIYVAGDLMNNLSLQAGMLVSAAVVDARALSITVWGMAW